MEYIIQKTIKHACKEGKELEIGLHTWVCKSLIHSLIHFFTNFFFFRRCLLPTEFVLDLGNDREVTGLGFKAGPKTLVDYYRASFHAHAKDNKTFIVFKEERYSFEQVEKTVKHLVNVLKERGIKKGDRVALCMRNYPEWCFWFIAVTLHGGIAVPLNGWWTTEELEYGLTDCQAKMVVVDETRFKRIQPSLPQLLKALDACIVVLRHELEGSVFNDNANVFDYKELLDAALRSNGKNASEPEAEKDGSEVPKIEADDTACLMYTSGTTGHPKGVILTHGNIATQMRVAMLQGKMFESLKQVVTARLLAEAAANGVQMPATTVKEDQSCIICPIPFFHVTCCHHIFLNSLIGGRKLVLMYKWDPAEALRLIEKERPQIWTGVPTMIQDMIEHDDFEKRDTSSLSIIGGGGAATPKALVKKVVDKFTTSPKFPSMPYQGYGMTETNGGVTTIFGEAYVMHPGSCGKAVPVCEICVVDETSIQPGKAVKSLEAGKSGELLIKSPLIMRGYWNKKEKTEEAFVEVDGKGYGWLRTGDIGKIDEEGYVYILDRLKDIIIRGGENISCVEVESAIYDHADVMECAVYGVKDERLGEVVGCTIVLKAGVKEKEPEALKKDLVAFLKKKLAAFKVPAENQIIIQTDPLPRGATGKILKRVMRDEVNSEIQQRKRIKT